jgi:glycosyltransferase involved in cell wall biosynthesis
MLLNNVKKDMEGISHEYILVDNGSTDGTTDKIRDWLVDNVHNNFSFIRNKENLGISIGKNLGVRACSGKYIIMLDGDVVPVPNSLRLMIKWMEENEGKNALGMYPNKFSLEPNKEGGAKHHEDYCDVLYEPRVYKCCCLYYGIFRRLMFTKVMMNEEGEYGKAGYGWEDHDFFNRMKEAGYNQYVAHINNEKGKYYHKINSSIRAMGRDKYIETSRARDKQFKQTWEKDGIRQGDSKPLGQAGYSGGQARRGRRKTNTEYQH